MGNVDESGLEIVDPIITLAQARSLSGLDLVSARDTKSESGHSYHDMEKASESKSHDAARSEAIEFFISLGYKVFPEGIGVKGIYTLSDCLAIRGKRVVFVEVLSDSNIKEETLSRKALLQSVGEICFVFFSGTNRATEPHLLAAKRDVELWADVLYCELNGYSGNRIKTTYSATVSYDTVRSIGIRVKITLQRSGKKTFVCVNFLTHLLRNPPNTPISHTVLPPSYCYEEIFREIFYSFAKKIGHSVQSSSKKAHVTDYRAIRRKSGLKIADNEKHMIAALNSEYRGPEIAEQYGWNYHPSTRDLPPQHIYGRYTLNGIDDELATLLIITIKEYGFTLEYDESSVLKRH